MKKTTIIFGILISASQLFAQTPADKLKQENQALKNQVEALKQDTTFLRKQVELCKLYGNDKTEILTSYNFYKIKLVSCTGDRASQKIFITLIIENSKPNQKFYPAGGKEILAIDSQGNQFKSFPSAIDVLTNVPTKFTFSFEGVLPSTDLLKVVNMSCNSFNVDNSYTSGSIELRNLKVVWN